MSRTSSYFIIGRFYSIAFHHHDMGTVVSLVGEFHGSFVVIRRSDKPHVGRNNDFFILEVLGPAL